MLADVSRQGGQPGTLYVMEADEDSVEVVEGQIAELQKVPG